MSAVGLCKRQAKIMRMHVAIQSKARRAQYCVLLTTRHILDLIEISNQARITAKICLIVPKKALFVYTLRLMSDSKV